MTARIIVRDDDNLSGRWHFEGTTIPIAVIVSDHDFGHDELKVLYRFMHLTDEEIMAGLAFEFPVVRGPIAFVEYASITRSVSVVKTPAKRRRAQGSRLSSVPAGAPGMWRSRPNC